MMYIAVIRMNKHKIPMKSVQSLIEYSDLRKLYPKMDCNIVRQVCRQNTTLPGAFLEKALGTR